MKLRDFLAWPFYLKVTIKSNKTHHISDFGVYGVSKNFNQLVFISDCTGCVLDVFMESLVGDKFSF